MHSRCTYVCMYVCMCKNVSVWCSFSFVGECVDVSCFVIFLSWSDVRAMYGVL